MESERVTWEFIGIIIVIVMKSIGGCLKGRRRSKGYTTCRFLLTMMKMMLIKE